MVSQTSLNSRMHQQMVSTSWLSNNGTENLHFLVISRPMCTIQDKVMCVSLLLTNLDMRGIIWLRNVRPVVVDVMVVGGRAEEEEEEGVGGWVFQQSTLS